MQEKILKRCNIPFMIKILNRLGAEGAFLSLTAIYKNPYLLSYLKEWKLSPCDLEHDKDLSLVTSIPEVPAVPNLCGTGTAAPLRS